MTRRKERRERIKRNALRRRFLRDHKWFIRIMRWNGGR